MSSDSERKQIRVSINGKYVIRFEKHKKRYEKELEISFSDAQIASKMLREYLDIKDKS